MDLLLLKLPMDVSDLKVLAEQQGIGWRSMERAKAKMGLDATKSDYRGGWRWEAP